MSSKKAGYGATVKELRAKLKLTQEGFATTYNIPLQTLRSWEQDTRKPDSAAASYLIVIATHPLLVRNTLAKVTKSPKR